MRLTVSYLLTFCILLVIPDSLLAQFVTGNLVVLRVGDGTSTLTSGTGASVNLLEFTTVRSAQTATSTTSIPSTGGNSLTLSGGSTTEGILGRSDDGRYLLIGGYRQNAGSSINNVERVIGRVDMNRNVDTTTSVTAATSFNGTSSIRSVASTDGTSYYLGGEGGNSARGIVYVSSHGVSGQSGTAIFNGNHRQVQVIGGQLHMSTGAGSGSAANYVSGLGRSNVALPTTTQTNADVTALFSQASGSTHQFVTLDLDAGVAGIDTIYAADLTSNQIDKYSFDGTTWTARGSLSVTGVNGIAARSNSGQVELFYTTASQFRSIIDTASFNSSISGLDDILISSAGTNFAYRSLNFTPVPEPASLIAVAAAGLGAVTWRRRRKA